MGVSSKWVRVAIGTVLYVVGRAIVRLGLALLTDARLEGGERIPRTGPLLVVANHASLTDPPLLAALFPRRLAFLAKEELFRPPLWGWAFRAAGMIPVRRGRPERGVLAEALEVLRAGGALAVFPEGRRSRDGVLLSAEPGVGLLAVRSGALVLPVAVLGTEGLDRPAGWLGRPRLVVRCGNPYRPTAPAPGTAGYRAVADEAMRHIAALLPPERRGPYWTEAVTQVVPA